MQITFLADQGDTISAGNHYITIRNTDLLQSRTSENPIERRAERKGRILFTIDGDKTEEFTERLCKVRLSCCDFEQKWTEFVYQPKELADDLLSYSHEEVKEYGLGRIIRL